MDRYARLADHVDLVTGFPFRSDEYVASGVRLLRGDNVGQGRLRWAAAKLWPSERARASEPFLLRRDDVVLAMDRPWIEAGLKYARVRPEDLPCLLVQRVARIRARDKMNQNFLGYLVGSRQFTDHVLALQTGTAVPHISGSQILDFRFMLPELAEQQGMAELLGALDDKIALNERMIETSLSLGTHEVARAVQENPQWSTSSLKDLAKWTSGGTPRTSEPAYWNGDIPWITASSLHSFFIDDSDRRITDSGLRNGSRLAPRDAVLIVVRGMSLKTEFRVGVAQRPVAFGQDCKALVAARGVDPLFLAYSLRLHAPDILQMVDEAGHGTGRLQTDRLGNLALAMPPDAGTRLLAALRQMTERAALAKVESRTLAVLLDALLPKLLSGELRVREAENAVSAAT